jgi:hypothetical protein
VFRVEQLGTPIPAGHKLGKLQPFFPGAGAADPASEA